MIEKVPPYDGATEYLIFNKKINEENIDFSNKKFTEEIITLINSMMSFDPSIRPTIDEILSKIPHWK